MENPDVRLFLTVEQVADRWQVSSDTVLRMIRQRRLAALKIGKRSYRVRVDDVEDYERENTVGRKVDVPRKKRCIPYRGVDHFADLESLLASDRKVKKGTK